MSNKRKTRRMRLEQEGNVSFTRQHGSASTGLSLRTFHLEVMGLGYVEQVVALRYGKLVFLAVLVDEGDPELLARLRRVYVAMPCGRGRRE